MLRSGSRGFRVGNLLALEPRQLIESGWASRGSAAGGWGRSWHGSQFLMLDRELVVQVTPLPPSDKPTLFSKIQQDSRNPTRLGEERAAFGLGSGLGADACCVEFATCSLEARHGAVYTSGKGSTVLAPLRFVWNATRGHRLTPWRSEYLRWRVETYSGQSAETLTAGKILSFLWATKWELLRFLLWTNQVEREVNRRA